MVRDQTKDRTGEIRTIMSRYPQYELVGLRLQDAFDILWWRSLSKPLPNTLTASVDLGFNSSRDAHNPAPLELLRTFLGSLPTPSAVSSSISHIIRLLLLHAAEARSCSHLLLGSTSTSLSISLISSVSSGGGFVLPSEREEIRRSVKIVKPLRDVTNKECAAWLHWGGLQVLQGGISLYEIRGVTQLTKDFIVGLDRNFPSTVSTISRTCAKLTPRAGTSGYCAFCQRSIQSGVEEWKARISIRSRQGPLPHTQHRVHPLCYSCHTAFNSKGSKGSGNEVQGTTAEFPVWVGSEEPVVAEHKIMEQHEMRVQIEEFLIQD